MTKRKRRIHSFKLKVRLALEALREEMTKSELAKKYDQHVTRSAVGSLTWKPEQKLCLVVTSKTRKILKWREIFCLKCPVIE